MLPKQVPVVEEAEEEEDQTDSVTSKEADPQPSTSTGKVSKVKASCRRDEIDQALLDLLRQQSKADSNLTTQIEAAISSAPRNEMEAWVEWMKQAVKPLPRHLWRDFTRDSHTLVLRYQERAELEHHLQPQQPQQPQQQPQQSPVAFTQVRPSSAPLPQTQVRKNSFKIKFLSHYLPNSWKITKM